MLRLITTAIFTLTSAAIGSPTPVRPYADAVAADRSHYQENSEAWAAAPHPLETLTSSPVTLIPFPREVKWTAGESLVLSQSLNIFTSGEQALTPATNALIEALRSHGVAASMAEPGNEWTFSITLDPKVVPHAEGYQLRVIGGDGGCAIVAHDAAGAFYAVQTLEQMLRVREGNAILPHCEITDYPAFGLRGFMHDTGRNFQSIESLKKQIDRFADYKLNAFHWHLTDNPAWRPESKIFPQLNDPKNRRKGRDKNSTYTFDQIRDVIAYAKERHVMIIPELDMPGHSQYFGKTFGFDMGSPQGMDVLEKLIDEFCAEIPADDCPFLHLGADEVHIPKPDEFITRMSAKVRANGRTPILWNPGLKPTDEKTVTQLWSGSNYSAAIEQSANPIIDSAGGYINSIDPQRIVQRYFFWQACKQAQGDDRALGGILCCWPDVNVNDKQNIFRHNPVWPGVLAFSESIWQGRASSKKALMVKPPERGTKTWLYFREFEARLCDHRDRYFANDPFPYVKQTGLQWSHSDPYKLNDDDNWEKSFAPETDVNDPGIKWHPTNGATVLLPYWSQPVPSTRYLRTYLHSDTAREAHLMTGFDTPGRANRRSSGIPLQGKWDQNGGTLFLNGKEVPPPTWEQPGKFRYEYRTWHKPPNEIPYTDEEFYWTREPVKVQLNKGANLILMRVPFVFKLQSDQATCVPVRKHNGRWVEDESVTSTRTP